MFRVLLIAILLSLSLVAAQDCSSSITIVERPGSWTENGMEHRIFDLHLTNTGSCSFSGTVNLKLTIPPGSKLGYSWGYNVGTQQIFGVPLLAPKESYSGIGLIFAGPGAPAVASQSCTCDSSNPPTAAPTDAPTAAPTAAPTDAPTSAPTSAPVLPPGSTYDRDLRILVLTCGATAETPLLNVANLILNSMGAPMDVLNFKTVGSAALTLNNADGTGKYYGMISTAETSCWSQAQLKQITDYETTYKVKMVLVSVSPSPANGVNNAPGQGDGTSAEGTLTYAPAMLPFARSMKTDVGIDVIDSWILPAAIVTATGVTAEPAFYITIAGVQYVGAAFINYADGRRHLEFYYAVDTWAFYAIVVGPAWLNWLSNGVFAGARRVVLSCHTDDVFMYTGMFNGTAESDTDVYRLSPSDVDLMVSWQQALIARMPAGSTFVTTFPFNGETITEFGGYTKDPLYLYMHNPAIRDQFYWESHTWSHPVLDTDTYAQCNTQWGKNNATALALFDNNLSNPMYNAHAVITPAITGLFNGQCLQAMWDLGIQNVCGDNTHPEQLPPNDYWGWYTNVTSNGFAGMFVVPRWATNVDYDASLPEHIVSEYNFIYGTSLTFADIMQMEIATNTLNLLAFRHDPYMFHQANMRSIIIPGHAGNTSLLAYWTDSVVNNTMQYTTLPLNSYKHEEQAAQLHAREARDKCGFTASLRMDTTANTIVGMHAVSTGTCTYAVSGVLATPTDSVKVETVGEETTIWLQMTPNNPIDVVFTTAIPILM